MLPTLRERLRQARGELTVLGVAFGHPRTPWRARAVLLLVVAYALSPIDLIPDFIPVLGLLDDALLLPLGILLARRLIPADVLEECRAMPPADTPTRIRVIGVTIVVLAWLAAALCAAWLYRRVTAS